jgi:hypothetical protein
VRGASRKRLRLCAGGQSEKRRRNDNSEKRMPTNHGRDDSRPKPLQWMSAYRGRIVFISKEGEDSAMKVVEGTSKKVASSIGLLHERGAGSR